MLLAVDVGNSQTVIGVFDGESLMEHWRVSTDSQRTADELALIFRGLMGLQGLSFEENIHGIVSSSVVPVVSAILQEMTQRYFRSSPLQVRPGTRTGMAVHTNNPREVGADRLVTALAAHDEYGGPGIVVDFGTATSFDVYTGAGAFVGGAIAPGIQPSMDALTARGAQLGTVALALPRNAIGRTTVEAMQSGAVYGFAGQVDRVVEELAEELPADPVVVATGGSASEIVAACRRVDHHDPVLALKGLRIIWERNT